MNLRQVFIGLIVSVIITFAYSSNAQQQVQIKGPKNATQQFSGSTYGPIKSSDTLWRIASRYKQNKNLSVYQVMQAIYELNPSAFEDQNYNHLVDGSILKLPSQRYIARIDNEQARLKAQRDDQSWSPKSTGDSEGANTTKLVSEQSVASKADLSQTKQVLEDRLTAIDEEQNRQFMAIRQQFAESIEGVQSLLTENQKMYERLDAVNQDIDGLRVRVDEEIQIQMNEMLVMQNELLAISKQAESERQAEMQKSGFAWLTEPLTLIILSILLCVGVLVGFAMWLMSKRKSQGLDSEPLQKPYEEVPIVAQSTEMDDLSDALSDELSGDLNDDDDDLFGEDDLLDDVLSEELQESLDEALDEELDAFDDLGDDMLVPEADKSLGDDIFDEGDAILDQGDLDSLFGDDEDFTNDIESSLDDIDLSDTSDITDNSTGTDSSAADFELDELLDEDVDDILAQVERGVEPTPVTADEAIDLGSTDDSSTVPLVKDDQEKPEISIDELLEQNVPVIPESMEMNDTDSVSEDMLLQLDKEINNQNEELDSITDELINEIDQLEQMGDLLPDDDEDDLVQDSSSDTEVQHSIQELDDLSEELIEELDDSNSDYDLADQVLEDLGIELAQNESKDLSEKDAENTELPELEAEKAPVADSQDLLADELLAELGIEDAPDQMDSVDTTESDSNDNLADELLAELGIDDDDQLPETTDAEQITTDSNDDLADELLAELGIDDDQLPETTDAEQITTDSNDDLADELLAELGIEPESEPEPELKPDEQPVVQSEENEDDASLEAVLSEEFTSDEFIEEPPEQLGIDNEDELPVQAESETELQAAPQDDVEHQSNTDIELDNELEDFEKALDEFEEQDLQPQSEATDHTEKRIDDLPSLDDIGSITDFEDDELEKALSEFDESGFEADDFEPVVEKNQQSSELDDLPGLGDWLTDDKDGEPSDTQILEELEDSSFDEILKSIDNDDDVEVLIEEQGGLLDNTDLDLDALLSEHEQNGGSSEAAENALLDESEEDFLEVDTLLNESIEAESSPLTERELDLDVALENYSGVIGDSDLIDVDGDQGIGAKLDLARAYIEMDDIDSAKTLLDEIISKSEDDYHDEATALLAQIVNS